MLLLMFALNLICKVDYLRANSHGPFITTTKLTSTLIHGFEDYPFVVWTAEKEFIPYLAETLIEELQKGLKPVELWQQSHASWLSALRFAPGKPFYAIFPPTHAKVKKNFLMKMLDTFTRCEGYESRVVEQVNYSIFFFFSSVFDGAREYPSKLQKADGYCFTPSRVFFLKYNFQDDQNTLIQLESLRGIRMRCHRKGNYACTELVHVNDPHGVLSYLTNENINLIQVEWRRIEQTKVFINSLSKSVVEKYGAEWENLKRVFLNRSIRDLMQLEFVCTRAIPFFEFIAHVNITVSAKTNSETNYFARFVVGKISTRVVTTVYSPGLTLLESADFKMIYGTDYVVFYNPFTAKSFLTACGTLELIVIFTLALLISVLRLKKYRFKDFIPVAISTLAPLVSQHHPYKTTKLAMLYYSWMISMFFSTTAYLSYLQSHRITPTIRLGNDTFKDLEDRQMLFYASYRAFNYIGGDNLLQVHKDNSKMLSRLSALVQHKEIWGMSTGEFRNFFQLSKWAFVADEGEMKPMSKVLTEVYSRSYHVLPEKIFPQFFWCSITIPHGEHLLGSWKGVQESGILYYWYKNYEEKRGLEFESVFREALGDEQQPLEEASDKFCPLNLSDSLLLEMITLFGLVLSLLITFWIPPLAYFRMKGWVSRQVRQLRLVSN